VEAMAYGCPVIACNVGAVPEVVGDAALVVQPRDAVGFAGHVAKLYEDRALRTALIERGRERATRFSWADSASRMMEVLGRVAARLPLRSESGRG
jgi:glycosyltransferase involved in cell wall biosynthesis